MVIRLRGGVGSVQATTNKGLVDLLAQCGNITLTGQTGGREGAMEERVAARCMYAYTCECYATHLDRTTLAPETQRQAWLEIEGREGVKEPHSGHQKQGIN